MRTKQSWVWGIFLSVVVSLSFTIFENNAEAQRRRQRVPANAQCTDSDNSPRNHNQAGRGEDRLTRGNTRYYSAQSRRYRTVTDSCNDQGQLVENYCDPVITYSYGRATTACGEGEICENGACQRSCRGPHFELSFHSCDEYLSPEIPPRDCYICSVTEDIRSRAACPAGWNYYSSQPHADRGTVYDAGVLWYTGKFACVSECHEACGGTQAEPNERCHNACPSPMALESPCPEGFMFEYPRDAKQYYCAFENDSLCLRSGTEQFGNSSANGNTFCGSIR